MAKTYILAAAAALLGSTVAMAGEYQNLDAYRLASGTDQNSQHVRTGLPWEAQRSLSTHHQTFP